MVHEESSCICNSIINNALVEGGLDVSFINVGYFREEQEENIGNNQAIMSIQIF